MSEEIKAKTCTCVEGDGCSECAVADNPAKVTPGYTGHNSLGSEAIERLFGHHSAAIEDPDSLRVATAEVHAEVRTAFKKLAKTLDELVPLGRGKSVMFTELETASMWAHKALAVRD